MMKKKTYLIYIAAVVAAVAVFLLVRGCNNGEREKGGTENAVSRRETISVAPGKGAKRPPPGVGTRIDKPARDTNEVKRDGRVPRGTEKVGNSQPAVAVDSSGQQSQLTADHSPMTGTAAPVPTVPDVLAVPDTVPPPDTLSPLSLSPFPRYEAGLMA